MDYFTTYLFVMSSPLGIVTLVAVLIIGCMLGHWFAENNRKWE